MLMYVSWQRRVAVAGLLRWGEVESQVYSLPGRRRGKLSVPSSWMSRGGGVRCCCRERMVGESQGWRMRQGEVAQSCSGTVLEKRLIIMGSGVLFSMEVVSSRAATRMEKQRQEQRQR